VFQLRLASGRVVDVPLMDMKAAYAPNSMMMSEKVTHFAGAIGRFLSESPRRSNVQGGVFPAILGTVILVLLMAVVVSPLGVLAAIYLQEYAQRGPITRLVRIAVNNLAGVPSVVYGVFGLGFFVYAVGGSLDALFFEDRLPAPTLGTPGMLWAALTMALLTLPVVIVSTEEGLARVPASLREGSLALGATRAETLWHVVLPAASPAVLTGLILAVARATGEVAPLLLIGVAKYAPGLPVSTEYPYLHLDRQFMHLGFYVYDLGFQSTHLETVEGLVFATALLLVVIALLLNIAAVLLRSRLRNAFKPQEAI
ncbi:phosphate ABC transporter permease PstA, partial [Congregibacter sp.]